MHLNINFKQIVYKTVKAESLEELDEIINKLQVYTPIDTPYFHEGSWYIMTSSTDKNEIFKQYFNYVKISDLVEYMKNLPHSDIIGRASYAVLPHHFTTIEMIRKNAIQICLDVSYDGEMSINPYDLERISGCKSCYIFRYGLDTCIYFFKNYLEK